MEERKIRVLHIIRDDKFIDKTVSSYEQDGRFENTCILIVDSPDYQINLVKNTEKIEILYNKQIVKRRLQRLDYDVVLFYSIPKRDYRLIKYIPKDRIIIWWTWGYDIYEVGRFIDIPFYKPKTLDYIKSSRNIKERVLSQLRNRPFLSRIKYGSRKKVLRRIDYFNPVIHSEYLEMMRYKYFKAKEFFSPLSRVNIEIKLFNLSEKNNVIIGHSATLINNHLDVWESVRGYIPDDTTVYFPINYGSKEYSEYLSSSLNTKGKDARFLKSFMPLEEYYKILDSCAYAVFGVIRQAAMGNIYRCLLNGVKVFLYKDSLPYKHFSLFGFFVFAIDDVDEMSFRQPLTYDQAIHNRECYVTECQMVHDVGEMAIKEIQDIVCQKKH